MIRISTLRELSQWLAEHPRPAFVPTMGALHDGHLSLVKAAKKTKRPVLVSVYVNPTQFGPHEDFLAYPRDEEGDAAKLENTGADAVFFPKKADMYPNDRLHPIPELPKVFSELEGEIRPEHFAGVAQVLYRFFQIIRPEAAFFGQKDFQQTVLVKWLVKTCGLETKIIICPTVREPSGLAMSSRNAYLSEAEREAAATLFRALQKGKKLFDHGEHDARNIIRGVEDEIKLRPFFSTVDYVDIRGAEYFEKVQWVAKPAVIVLAARVGKTRLIDNILIG